MQTVCAKFTVFDTSLWSKQNDCESQQVQGHCEEFPETLPQNQSKQTAGDVVQWQSVCLACARTGQCPEGIKERRDE